MAAGIPGVGIAGLFFVICALWMPFVEVWNWSRGRGDSDAMRLALRQASIAAGVLIWLIGTGWLLLLLPGAASGLLTVTGLIGTTLLLGLVLGCLKTLAVFVRGPQQEPT